MHTVVTPNPGLEAGYKVRGWACTHGDEGVLHVPEGSRFSGHSKQCTIQQLPGKAGDAQGEQAHPGMQRLQGGSWGTTSREGVKAEDLSLLEKGRHRGWMRNKDQMKHGFEKYTLLLNWDGGHPRFESSYSPVASALAFAQLLIKCD